MMIFFQAYILRLFACPIGCVARLVVCTRNTKATLGTYNLATGTPNKT
jgi:hypothetical protein